MTTTPINTSAPPQAKPRRKKGGKKGGDGSISPVDSNQGNEVIAPLKLVPEVMEPTEGANVEGKKENEAIKEISRYVKFGSS